VATKNKANFLKYKYNAITVIRLLCGGLNESVFRSSGGTL
jgi:hypothetical protein